MEEGRILPQSTRRTRRSWINVLSLICVALLFPVLSCNSPPEPPGPQPETWQEARPLHEVYRNEFLLGNIIRNTSDFSNVTRSGILKRHYNIVTAENDMKPQYIAPTSNNWIYRFSTADEIVNKAREAGFFVHGHTLIWHDQTPSWLTEGNDRTVILGNLEKYVTDVVTHFKGRVISWDVVNEAFLDDGSLRSSPWKKAGDDYIEKAFRAAREADPDVKLYYNDYGMNGVGKRDATFNMVKNLNDKWRNEGKPGKLIDGIGMQTHHHLNTNPQTVRASIEKFASLGVEVGITEMDIIAANWPSLSLGAWDENAAKKQAAQYAAMFRVFKDNASHISRVTFWGLDDGTSWRGGQRNPSDGGSSGSAYPTLMNSDYSLKPAFHAVANPNSY